jgi:hypothetical protein
MTTTDDRYARFLRNGLAQFTGTETWYRHFLPGILFTEGVKFLADQANAYWLIDKIACAQIIKQVSAEEFQVWKLKVRDDTSALLTATDGDRGDGPVELFAEGIPYTDFPLDEITLYAGFDGRGAVIMLPGEY